MRLHVQQSRHTAVTPSPHVMQVAAMFGLGLDDQRQIEIIGPTEIDLQPHQLVFITGDSGGGKSTLLRLIHEQLTDPRRSQPQPQPKAQPQREAAVDTAAPPRVLRFTDLPNPPDAPLVDCFGDLPLELTLSLLSRAGLNDAFVMLRRPTELSDGQRYRLGLAQLMHGAVTEPTHGDDDDEPWTVVIADEFGATLDRTTAAVLARNVRKWTRLARVCFIAATTHDDLLEPLEPDLLIEKPLGPELHIHHR